MEWKGLAAAILVVAGEDLDREGLSAFLGGGGRTLEWLPGDQAVERINRGGLDLVVLDLAARGTPLLDLVGLAREMNPGLEVVVLAGHEDVQTAAEALEKGAADYLTKPLDFTGLADSVDRVLDIRRLQIAGNIAAIVHRLAATRETSKLAPRVVDAALQATRAKDASVYLYEDGKLTLLGSSEPEEREEVHAVVIRVLDTGLPVQTIEEEQGPILGWPMVAHDAGIGVIAVRRDPGSAHFGAADEQQMSIVAMEAALSIDRVRLVDRLRKQVDDLARARTKLAAGEQLQGVGQLATGYAHELQGPLQYLQSHLRAASDALVSEEYDEVDKGLEIALDTAARIQSMVGELSLLGRGKEDAVIDAKRIVSLGRRIALANAKVPVTEAVAYCGVQGNVGHLVQAMVHLLRNAVRAVEDVEEPAIRIEVVSEDDEVRFSVEDNGPGLPDGVGEEIYEPFVSHWDGHAGLGLGVAREIIEGAGGRLVVRNRSEEGAEASMWLPGVQDDSTLELGGEEEDDDEA